MYNIHIRTGKLEPNRTESNRYHAGIYIHTYIHIQKIVDIYIYIHASYTIYKHHVDSDAINSCRAIMACHVDWDQPLRRCAVASVTEMGVSKSWGAPQNHPSHETFLVLKPTVTWRSPVLGHQIMSIIWRLVTNATLEIPRDRWLDDFMENPQKKWMMDDDW